MAINTLLTIIIAYSGIIAGFLLAKIAEEELEAGTRHFQAMQNIILTIGAISFLDKQGMSISIFLLLSAIIPASLLKIKPGYAAGYLALTLMLIYSEELSLTSTLIFLYGLPTAAILKIPITGRKKLFVIGHRGAPAYEPENTIRSYKEAEQLGADMIEMDVRMTKDQQLITMHDKTINRTTNGKGKIKEMTLSQLQKYSVQGQKILTLKEVIKKIKKPINLDVKDTEAIPKVIETLKKKKMIDKVIISSFNKKTLKKTKELSPQTKTALLFINPLKLLRIKKLDLYALHPSYYILTKGLAKFAHKKNLKINVFRIDDLKKLTRAKTYGIDGVIIDDPLLAKGKCYDLHVHTKYSRCAALEPAAIINLAKKKGMNGIAITDHNTTKGALEAAKSNKDKDFEVIIGEEVKTDKGEVLALYIKKQIKPGRFEEVIKEIKKQKGLAVIAHPYTFGLFRKALKIPLEKIKDKINGIETKNGRNFFKFENLKAEIKAKELDIAQTSGSDAHFSFEIGKCYTVFQDDLRKALSKNNTKIYGTIKNSVIARALTMLQKYLVSPFYLRKL